MFTLNDFWHYSKVLKRFKRFSTSYSTSALDEDYVKLSQTINNFGYVLLTKYRNFLANISLFQICLITIRIQTTFFVKWPALELKRAEGNQAISKLKMHN